MNEEEKYTRVAIVLHWLLALALIAQIALGFWMGEVPKDPPGIRAQWFNLHKSIGLLLAGLIVVRLAWRLTHRPPQLPSAFSAVQQKLTHLGHGALYILMLVVPVSGFVGSSFTQYPIKFFGLALPRLWDASPELKDLFAEIHETTVFMFIALVVGHIAVAMWHAIAKDGVMQRMSLRTPKSESTQ
jgi:cytochrome b561